MCTPKPWLTRSIGILALFAMVWLLPKPASADSAPPAYCSPCLFYGGDFSQTADSANGFPNLQTLSAAGSAWMYTPFVVPNGQQWHVSGLFTNNIFSGLTAESAAWEIRSGMFPVGNSTDPVSPVPDGGTLLYSGSGLLAGLADTGHVGFFGLEIYAAIVDVGDILLGPGRYWMSVAPTCLAADDPACNDAQAGAWQVTSGGANAFGPAEPVNRVAAYWPYTDPDTGETINFIGPMQTGTYDPGTDGYIMFDTIVSGGVVGVMQVPEPATIGLFALGVLAALGLAWRRRTA